MSPMKFSRLLPLIFVLAVPCGQAIAQDESAAGGAQNASVSRWIDPGWRRTLARYDVRFEEDGTSNTVFEFEVLLSEPKALHSVAQQVFSYNAYFDELKVDELATVKPDGRRVTVDPRAVNDQPARTNPSSPYFDEERILTIAYPDVAPGDRVKGRLVYTSKRPRFPGAFAQFWMQPQDRPAETIELTLTGPASRPLQINAVGVEHTSESVGDRIVHRVRFRHEAATEPHDATGRFDTANRFEASTFADYASFAALLRQWNAPMAVPGAEVSRLSREIVGEAIDTRAKAERIFNWVAKNIRYVGIGFADGGYVSQPVADVIRARYGDCKAHATVLKSLLAAQGIEADFTVVNSGLDYTISAVPTPNFDHAIVYLPALDLYLDPTDPMTSFGALPVALYGKPALDIDKGLVSKIPPAKPSDFVVAVDTSMTFDLWGIRHAEAIFSGQGVGADLSRAVAERLEDLDTRRVVEKELRGDGFEGTGTYAFANPREPANAYAISASFELNRLVSLNSETRIRLFVNADPRPAALRLISNYAQDRAFRCLPLDYSDSSTIELPQSLNLAEMPMAVAYDRDLKGRTRYGTVTGHIKVDGRIAVEGRKVRAVYHVAAAFDSAVCPAEFYAEIKQVLQKGGAFRGAMIAVTPQAVARVVERGSTYQAGLTAYRAGNYEAALKEFRPIAEQGDVDAQAYLGSMYKDGRGVAKDYAQALAWYRKAAERGSALGQSNLAFMYSEGLGVGVDEKEAAHWLRKSADLGDAYSQCRLGEMYEHGKGVAQNLAQARLLYTAAAEQGYNRAAHLLGLMYSKGKGVEVDYARANEWYRKAADKDYAWAQLDLGMLYAEGHGVERDYKQAVAWFRKAAERGNAVAQNNMGYAYESGLGVEADPTEARQWYIRAANQGHEGAKAKLNADAQSPLMKILKQAIRMVVQ
jgi:TPR repeat protein/transglutaminase-like putative cysteine protease